MELPDPRALFDLQGRVAVVTGASAGLGQELARVLAGAGTRLVLAARRIDRLEAFADELCAAGAEAVAVKCDVTNESDVAELCAKTRERYGAAQILVNNAGITEIVKAEEEPEATFRRVVDVNLHGVYWCCQAFGRDMLEAGSGAIVNVASILGLVGAGQIPQASYAASKGAVVNLTRELGAQWARRGVRVNAIAPGWFESEMTGEMFGDEGSIKWMNSRTPMGRAGQPGELGGALLYLASDGASFVTGQTLAVDGGWTIV